MTRIGLLSDTHGQLDPKLDAYLESCDEVWHAGDVGNAGILEELDRKYELRAVHGNIDGSKVRTLLRFSLEEGRPKDMEAIELGRGAGINGGGPPSGPVPRPS